MVNTYARYVGTGAYPPPTNAGHQPYVAEAIIDFSTTGNTNVATDVFQVIKIPAGTMVLAAGTEVLVVDSAGNSGTVLLTAGDQAQGSATAPTSTGFLAAASEQTPVVPSGSAAYVYVTVGTGAINAKCRFYAVLLPVKARNGTAVVTGSGTYTTMAATDTVVA